MAVYVRRNLFPFQRTDRVENADLRRPIIICTCSWFVCTNERNEILKKHALSIGKIDISNEPLLFFRFFRPINVRLFVYLSVKWFERGNIFLRDWEILFFLRCLTNVYVK